MRDTIPPRPADELAGMTASRPAPVLPRDVVGGGGRNSSHWLLEGPGFSWLRFLTDVGMRVAAVVAAVASGIARDGQAALMRCRWSW